MTLVDDHAVPVIRPDSVDQPSCCYRLNTGEEVVVAAGLVSLSEQFAKGRPFEHLAVRVARLSQQLNAMRDEQQFG